MPSVSIKRLPAEHDRLRDTYQYGTLSPAAVAQYQAIGVKFETSSQAGLPAPLIGGSPWNFEPRSGFGYRMSQTARAA